MTRSHFARLFVTLFIFATFSSPPAWGTPSRFAGEELLDIFTQAWGSLAAIWAPAGCNADPHGGCAPEQEEAPIAQPMTDEGCNADPHGGCRPGS